MTRAPAPAGPTAPPDAERRVRIGAVPVDRVTLDGALEAIARLVEQGRGGSVFTPNVDHVVKADRDAEFREAYAEVSLSLADGMPVVWATRLLGQPVPEKVSGSDLVEPLARLAAARGWRLYLLGGAPGVARAAADALARRHGTTVVGTDDAMLSLDAAGEGATRAALDRVRAARPHVVLVALGAPKQEIWIQRHREALRPAVAVGVGASLDFVAGVVRRAPRWMSRVGLEWLFRLAQEPRRLWRRYLVDDPAFVGTVLRSMRARRASRAAPPR